MLTLDSRDTCGMIDNKKKNKILRIWIQNIEKFKITIFQMKKGKGRKESLFILHRYIRAENACVPNHRYHGNGDWDNVTS